MSNYKYIVDALSSTAALIAIITVLISWFKNAQSALKVERVVIHRKEAVSNYILVIKNRKPYPVIIKSASCYMKASYKVEKKNNQNPEYMETLSLSDRLFANNNDFEIAANGHTDIIIPGGVVEDNLLKLLFSLQTSHGYHEHWCKKIITVDMTGKTKVFGMEYMYDTDSKLRAKAKYFYLTICNLCKIKN